jgi:rare lipoprotein A (peptidoglycan hydrolase)
MRVNAILRHKHLINTILSLSVIGTIITPAPVLAFEFPTLPPEITPIAVFEEDTPELSESYLSSTLVANASPVTQVAVHPKEAKVRKRTPRAPLAEPVILEGTASYYSRAGCLGCNPLFVMANGQVLDDSALTMAIGAHLSHLVGYQARVTNLANGKSVVVRITDTGGFYQDKYGNRVADLTIGTKQAIGMNGGLGKVRVEVF